MEKIKESLQNLIQQPNNFKPINEYTLEKMKNEVAGEFAGQTSEIKAEMNQLTSEVAKQSKTVTHTATTMEDSLVSAEKLSET